jgi:hypothetical protein
VSDLPVIITAPNTAAAIDKTVAGMICDHGLPGAMRATDLFDFVRMPQLTRREWLVDGQLTVVRPRAQDRFFETAAFLRRWLGSVECFAPEDLHITDTAPDASHLSAAVPGEALAAPIAPVPTLAPRRGRPPKNRGGVTLTLPSPAMPGFEPAEPDKERPDPQPRPPRPDPQPRPGRKRREAPDEQS